MKELIEQIKLKADSIPTNTKENRRVKGAYVDCLMMAKEASKNLVLAHVSGELPLPEIIESTIDTLLIKRGEHPDRVRNPLYGEERELAKALLKVLCGNYR